HLGDADPSRADFRNDLRETGLVLRRSSQRRQGCGPIPRRSWPSPRGADVSRADLRNDLRDADLRVGTPPVRPVIGAAPASARAATTPRAQWFRGLTAAAPVTGLTPGVPQRAPHPLDAAPAGRRTRWTLDAAPAGRSTPLRAHPTPPPREFRGQSPRR